ncbi:MAG: peptidoglycan-binding protein [Gammaproteobacteria bacterium]|nr:peptidoglycan-binding protein [Gammaproteobacteria bacterium]MCY4228620.1 peptidoglycan-binding protein [Gammaproteobacteria bacterium]
MQRKIPDGENIKSIHFPKIPTLKAILIALLVVCFIPMTLGQGVTEMKQGEGGSVAQGAAGPSGSTQGSESALEQCDKPMGAIAVIEPQDFVVAALLDYGLQSPVGVVRMMIQQSNCFIVVERGQGMNNMMQERALMEAGQLREDSNIGGGQIVIADFLLRPEVVFSESDAGGVGGGVGAALGGLFGPVGSVVGGLAGGLKFKEAQTSMLVADARSGVQVAAATGSSKKADMALGGVLLGGGGGAGLGGYGSTNEGKIIVASLMDNYNNIVMAVRNQPSLQRDVGTLAEEAAGGGSKKAGAVFAEGDVLYPKIDNVKLLSDTSDAAKQLGSLKKSDEMIYMGEENSGFVRVETNNGGGWVKKILVTRK